MLDSIKCIRKRISENNFQVEERDLLDEILNELTNTIRNACINTSISRLIKQSIICKLTRQSILQSNWRDGLIDMITKLFVLAQTKRSDNEGETKSLLHRLKQYGEKTILPDAEVDSSHFRFDIQSRIDDMKNKDWDRKQIERHLLRAYYNEMVSFGTLGILNMKFDDDINFNQKCYKNQWSPQQVERGLLYDYYRKMKGFEEMLRFSFDNDDNFEKRYSLDGNYLCSVSHNKNDNRIQLLFRKA